MIRRVTRCGDRNDIPRLSQLPAGSKGANRLRREFERYWIEPGGPPIRKVSTHTAYPSACRAEFAGSNKDFAMWEMCKASIMIHMQMGKHDPLDIARTDSKGAKLWPNFLFTVDPKLNFPSDIWMKRRPSFEQVRSLASVDDNDFPLYGQSPTCMSVAIRSSSGR